MKKTIIALMALAGVAAANATTIEKEYTPFSSDSGWTLTGLGAQDGSDVGKNIPTISNNSIYATNPNWRRPVGNYTFAEAITLTDKAESIEFSFSMSDVVQNSVATLTFEGSDASGARALVMGETYKGTNGANNANYAFGTGAYNDGDAYLLGSDSGWGGQTYNVAANSLTTLGALTSSATFEGSIKWSDTDNQFKFTLEQGENTASYLLGNKYTLSGLTVALDGKGNAASPKFSNFTITATLVPEPTTATLSLLALAGLAARRRRK